jgi:hypothetical protein
MSADAEELAEKGRKNSWPPMNADRRKFGLFVFIGVHRRPEIMLSEFFQQPPKRAPQPAGGDYNAGSEVTTR